MQMILHVFVIVYIYLYVVWDSKHNHKLKTN